MSTTTTATGSPWLAIALAVLALLGVVATASGPVIVERIRARRVTGDERPASTPPAPPIVPDSTFALVEESWRDLRAQRDAAQARVDHLDEMLDREQQRTAALRLRLAHYERGGDD